MLSARHALPYLLPLLMVTCGSPTAAHAVPSKPLPASFATEPSPSTAPDATPIATPLPAPPAGPPDLLFVGFAGLAPGSYSVHLHRVCSGFQGYHLASLPDLAISAAGSGELAVPAGDFGQGWCVIVYATRALTTVAAYRPI
jgi:hypothetical protein